MYESTKDIIFKIGLFLEDLDSGISIIELNEPFRQVKLIKDISYRLEKKYLTLDLKNSQLSLLEEIKASISEKPEIEIIFLKNLHLLGNSKLSNKEILTDLNFSRDLLVKLNKILVFILPTYFVDLIINNAPDFYDFVSQKFKIPIEKTLDLLPIVPVFEDDKNQRYLKNRAIFLESIVNENPELNKNLVLNLKELGDIYFKLKLGDKSLEYLGKALEIAKKLQDKSLIGNILNSLSQTLLYTESMNSVIPLLNQAEELFTETNNKKGVLETNINKGNFYKVLNEIEKSQFYYEKSLEISKSINDNHSKAFIFIKLSGLYLLRNDIDKAIELLFKASNIYLEDENYNKYIDILVLLSNINFENEDKKEAIENLEMALKLAEKFKLYEEKKFILYKLGYLYYQMKEYDKSIEKFKKCLEISKDTNIIIHSLIYLSEINKFSGNYEQSLDILSEALKIAEDNKYYISKINIMMIFGSIHIFFGEYYKALEAYQDAYTLSLKSKHNFLEAFSTWAIGFSYLYLNMYQKAIQAFEKSLKKFIFLGEKIFQLKVLENISSTYYYKGNFYKSIGKLKEALKIAEEINEKNIYLLLLNNIAICYTYLGKINKSIEFQRKVIDFKEKECLSGLEESEMILNQLYSLKETKKFENIEIDNFVYL